jgi:hypothetical protein
VFIRVKKIGLVGLYNKQEEGVDSASNPIRKNSQSFQWTMGRS